MTLIATPDQPTPTDPENIVKTLLAVAAACIAIAVASTTADNSTNPAGTEQLDADGLPPRIEYLGHLSYDCDEQWHATAVVPDNPDAHRAAERGCTRMRLSLERLQLPGGMTVQPGAANQLGTNP